MLKPRSHNEKPGLPRAAAVALAGAALFGLAAGSAAGLIPGGGAQKSDCYAELEVAGIENPSQRVQKNKIVLCTDGEACDTGPCGDNRCDMELTLCINQHDPNLPTCTPPANLDRLKAESKGKVKINIGVPQALTGSVCGALLDLPLDIPLKKNGLPKKFGQAKLNVTAKAPKGTKPRTDGDEFTVKCLPRTVACPAPTTTTAPPTTTTSTTSSTAPTTSTTSGTTSSTTSSTTTTQQPTTTTTSTATTSTTTSTSTTQPTTTTTTTTSTSSTTTTTLAACCGFDPTRLSFTTTVGSGNCGTVVNSLGSTLLTLRCAGLYFGTGSDSVPLPAAVPDLGTNLTNITACDPGTGAITLAHRTAAQTGSNLNCTAAGCKFGAPLPIPNATNIPTSTCVINTVASNVSGSGNCLTGASSVNIPLSSEIFLTGDLLAGTPGIQPCPLCVGDPTPVDGVQGGTCAGGPNDGLACDAQTSAFKTCDGGLSTGVACTGDADCSGGLCNQAYPTSHDCPPSNSVGTLPIGFALTTGTASNTAVDQPVMQRVFCGFCWDDDGSNGAAGGAGTCTLDSNYTCLNSLSCSSVGKGACQGAVACTSDADCAAVSASRESCRQKDFGAFTKAAARTITLTGTPAGDMTDGAAHSSTLVSTFCIPPTFDGTVDNSGALPGPGATALTGTAQLLP